MILCAGSFFTNLASSYSSNLDQAGVSIEPFEFQNQSFSASIDECANTTMIKPFDRLASARPPSPPLSYPCFERAAGKEKAGGERHISREMCSSRRRTVRLLARVADGCLNRY